MIIPFFVFIIGICIGSFLNVVIDRGPEGESIIKGRSHCDHCKKTLQWFDLIPIISFIFLSGKCRYCKKKLSIQYPLVEFFTGLLLLGIYFFLPYQNFTNTTLSPSVFSENFHIIELVFSSILVFFMIVIFMIDLKLEIVLEDVINSAILITFLYQLTKIIYFFLNKTILFSNLADSAFYHLVNQGLINLSCGFIAALFFLFLIEVSRHRGMGEGDVKIAFWMGIVLGYYSFIALFIAFLGGAIVGIFLIFSRKRKFGQTVPLAPFLMSGMYISLLWGEKILNFYFNTFLR